MPPNRESSPLRERPGREYLTLCEESTPSLKLRLKHYRSRVPSQEARKEWTPDRPEWANFYNASAKTWLTERLLNAKELQRSSFAETMSVLLKTTLETLTPPEATDTERQAIRSLHERHLQRALERAWDTVKKENERGREKEAAKEMAQLETLPEAEEGDKRFGEKMHTRFIAPTEDAGEDVFEVILQKAERANQYLIGITCEKKGIDMNFVLGPSKEKATRIFEAVKEMGRSVTFERVKETIQEMNEKS